MSGQGTMKCFELTARRPVAILALEVWRRVAKWYMQLLFRSKRTTLGGRRAHAKLFFHGS